MERVIRPGGEQQLTGGFLTNSVTRNGDTVRRSPGPWSPAVHAWLAHLDKLQARVAPSPIELDVANRVETLSYLHGAVPSGGASPPYLWREDTLKAVAHLIRHFHDASADFTVPPAAGWQPTGAYPGGGDVICHNDLAPWNTVFVQEQPVGFIDWDLAAPGPRLWDVAFALWHFTPLYGDPSSDPFDVAVFEPRARRVRVFCDAYGLADRDQVVDMIIKRQSAASAAIERGAQAGDPAYQRLWELGARDGIQRQIRYVEQHREDLEQALV